MDNKIVVPEEMLKAARDEYQDDVFDADALTERMLQAALRWLSENPIVPTRDQVAEIDTLPVGEYVETYDRLSGFAVEWQRRMFLG